MGKTWHQNGINFGEAPEAQGVAVFIFRPLIGWRTLESHETSMLNRFKIQLRNNCCLRRPVIVGAHLTLAPTRMGP
jgi:hypothetical protein